MARHVLKSLALAALVIALSGCTGAGEVLSVLRGNLAYGRGDYQSALVHYMASEESAGMRGWIVFNIGNVYYALGEQEAALAAWDNARTLAGGTPEVGTPEGEAESTTLIHAASYNRGVLYYQLGQFQLAYDEFRYALGVDHRSLRTKTNLELALAKLRSAESAQEERGPGEADAPGSDEAEQTTRILEYVRRKEAQEWYANREIESAEDARDW